MNEPVKFCKQCIGVVGGTISRITMDLRRSRNGAYWWTCPRCGTEEQASMDAVLQHEGAPRLPGF